MSQLVRTIDHFPRSSHEMETARSIRKMPFHKVPLAESGVPLLMPGSWFSVERPFFWHEDGEIRGLLPGQHRGKHGASLLNGHQFDYGDFDLGDIVVIDQSNGFNIPSPKAHVPKEDFVQAWHNQFLAPCEESYFYRGEYDEGSEYVSGMRQFDWGSRQIELAYRVAENNPECPGIDPVIEVRWSGSKNVPLETLSDREREVCLLLDKLRWLKAINENRHSELLAALFKVPIGAHDLLEDPLMRKYLLEYDLAKTGTILDIDQMLVDLVRRVLDTGLPYAKRLVRDFYRGNRGWLQLDEL